MNTQVIFSAVQKEDNIGPNVDITFTKTIANIGGGMDPFTGTFTVPVSGLYSFSFSAECFDDTRPSVYVYKNDHSQYYIETLDNVSHMISYVWMMSLVKNDKIHLKMKR